MQFKSINPYNGQTLKVHEGTSRAQVDQIINNAREAFLSWRKTSYESRKELMLRCEEELLKNKKKYSESITLEMGKPINESNGEIEKCAKVCRYYAEKASSFLADTPLETPHGDAYIQFSPLGVVLAVMPWNFPFWQVFRFAAPAVMAGNTCLLKHASNVPQCALDIEEVFVNAGFPNYIFNTLLLSSSEVKEVIENPHIAAVTLTGSEFAGSKVAAIAGANIKKSVLELGGSDAFIVLSDADLDVAAETAVKARMLNTGQSCIAAKRFIVEKDIYDEFTDRYIQKLKQLKYGDPMDTSTDFGTLAREDLATEIFDQVKKSIEMGAELMYGSLPDSIDSAYFPPLILGNLSPGMPAHDEEIFGPVAAFFKADDEQHAIEIANNSAFGLGGSLWTGDKERGRKLAGEIESGAIYINQMMFSDPTVPFGGIKKSGYGRELSYLGIREFTNQKTVWVKT